MMAQTTATASRSLQTPVVATEKPKRSRILTLDLLRGYFLFEMILNHLDYWPNLLDWSNARAQLFASGAEGFFLISGIVLGIVRGQKLLDKPMSLVSRLLLKRGLQLYVTYVITVIFFTLVGWWLFIHNPGLKFGIAPTDTPLLTLIWNTLTFQYVYGWADYLRLYAIFLALSPLVMWLLRRGKWWIVIGASVLVWAVVPRPDYPQNVFLQPYHWQLLFFGGMTVGFHWDRLRAYWLARSSRMRRTIIATIAAVSISAVAANIFIAFGGDIGPAVYNIVAPLRTALSTPFDKENLGFWRVIYVLGCFITGYWLFHRFERLVMRIFGWLWLPFGTNSLYVYTVQAFIVFFIQLVVPAGNTFLPVNVLLSFGTLGSIWVMIRYRVLFKVIPR